MKKQRFGAMDITAVVFCCLLTAVSTAFLFLSTCGADMHCHQTNLVAAIVGAILLVLTVLAALLKGKAGAVLSLVAAIGAVIEAMIPGTIMGLCMMPEMFCRSVMKPCIIILAILITAISLINSILKFRKSAK